MKVFNFRIIYGINGIDIIDQNLYTPYNSLTPREMQDYIEVDNHLETIAAMKRIENRKCKQKYSIFQKMAMILKMM